MTDRPNPEALARALGCDPYDMPTRPLNVDGVTIGGGIERRCGTHHRAMSQCRMAKVAERILADPGPLLEALAEAGVLTEVTSPLKRNCRGEWAAVYDGNHTTEGRRYVTEWRPDARP